MQKGQGQETSKHDTSKRGFASMDPKKQREIARKGGESVPAEKRSFSKDHELAATAGRKGGQSVPAEERSFSKNRGLAAEAGREGGKHSQSGKSRGEKGASEGAKKSGQR
jgi:general stress protein YciG